MSYVYGYDHDHLPIASKYMFRYGNIPYPSAYSCSIFWLLRDEILCWLLASFSLTNSFARFTADPIDSPITSQYPKYYLTALLYSLLLPNF